MYHVPVLNINNEPLMPTNQFRAERWIVSGKATGFWKKGVFCVRLNVKTNEEKQDVAVGIDPGSKKEGFTVKSGSHTYLNAQADAVTWVMERMDTRKFMRRGRRNRKCPCRQPRFNRASLRNNKIRPSAKARWQWKLRILNWLRKLFPVLHVIVEDIKAQTKGQRRWDKSFSPLQVGKTWFYEQIDNLTLKCGWETKELRDGLGLKKSKNKMSKSFDAHCVDSWVLANFIVGGHVAPDNKHILYIRPLRFNRRQLHILQPSKGGKRRRQGGTMSMGLKRGSLIKHSKHGLTYIGGTKNNRISLHAIDSKRISRDAKFCDCKFLTYNTWVCNGI